MMYALHFYSGLLIKLDHNPRHTFIFYNLNLDRTNIEVTFMLFSYKIFLLIFLLVRDKNSMFRTCTGENKDFVISFYRHERVGKIRVDIALSSKP